MGRGDRRTKRGKIWRGTHGNSRPKEKSDREKLSAILICPGARETRPAVSRTCWRGDVPARGRARSRAR